MYAFIQMRDIQTPIGIVWKTYQAEDGDQEHPGKKCPGKYSIFSHLSGLCNPRGKGGLLTPKDH